MFELIGSITIVTADNLGKFGLFCIAVGKRLLRKGFSVSSTLFQMNQIGVNSIPVVALTGAAIGGIMAIHAYDGLHRFSADEFLGPLVYLSMCREFGSVIAAIMVIARAGSAMTAEIGSMNISEQIDALTTLSIDPLEYVVIPRVVATSIIMPLLSLFCVIFGVALGYVVSIHVLGVNGDLYVDSIKTNLILSDITYGLVKAFVFGLLSALICTYKGIYARGGARGIGVATTSAVVMSCVMVFLADFILTRLLFGIA